MTLRAIVFPLLLTVICFGFTAPAPGQPTSLDSLRHFDVQPLGSYSAIWGYTAPDGREYALLGVNGSSGGTPYPGGTSIIEITNTNAVQQVAFIGGPNSQWREMKTFRHYGYVVSEGGGGVQIINLSQLPDTAWLVKSFNYISADKNTLRSHSISIHDGFMYLNGCANWSPGGILIFDLRTNPENPVFVGQYQQAYIHDSYVLRDTIYASAINSGGGLYIADATNKASVQTIGLISYPNSGTHNAWVTKNRSHVITTDEIGTTQKNLKFWNISSLPTIPGSPAATYTPSPGEIVHNVTVRGDYAYVAWYTAGVRVVNIANPASPANAGGFDTSPLTSGYNGVWGVYPYFPSGKIIAGDIQNGLWVFSFSGLAPRQPVQLLAPANAAAVFDTVSLTLRWTKTANLSKDPHYYTLFITGPGIDFSVNVNDSVYVLTNLAGFQSGETYQWHVRARDEFNDTASPDTFSFQYNPVPPVAPALILPNDGAVDQPLLPTLTWLKAAGATSYLVQVSTDSLFTNIIVEDSTANDTVLIVGTLLHNTAYYWRVRGENSVGSSGWSFVWSFLTVPPPPTSPALLAPADGVTGVPPTPALVWTSSPGAVSYRLQLSTDSLFGSFVVNQAGLSDTAYAPVSLMNLTTYHWRVSGTNAGGEGAFSASRKFTTVIAVPGTPNLVAPLNGAANLPTSVSLHWNVANASQRYRVQVSPDSLFSVMSFEDSTSTDTSVVTGSLIPGVQYFWRVRGENNAWVGAWSGVRAFSVSTQTTGQYTLSGGWNLVSLPLVVNDSSVTGIYPQAVSSLYGFNPTGGYVPSASLQPGFGYWLKFADSTEVTITGAVRYADTIQVQTGWNLIGALSEPLQVAEILEMPAGIVASDFFGYNGAYFVADTLLPGRAYWVKSSKAGFLVLSAPPVDGKGHPGQPEGKME